MGGANCATAHMKKRKGDKLRLERVELKRKK